MPLRLQVFVDRCVLEVYANGRECLTVPVPFGTAKGLKVEFLAEGGNVRVKTCDVWRMKRD